MQQGLAQMLLAATSEAEAMNYLAQLPLEPGCPGLRVPPPARQRRPDLPAHLGGKAAVARILRDRQAAAFGQARTDPATRRTIAAWRDTRARLARLILATADGRDHPERARSIQQLGAEKERLERELAAALPEFARSRALDAAATRTCSRSLPEGTTVLDLVRFTRFEQDPQIKGKKGERRTPGYRRLRAVPGPAGADGGPRPGRAHRRRRRPGGAAPSTPGRIAPPPRPSAGWSGSRWPATCRPARPP